MISSQSNSSRTKNTQIDPYAEERKRRELREEYANLFQETLESQKDIVSKNSSSNQLLEDILKRGNQLHKRIFHAREGALDAKWFTTTSRLGNESVQKIVAKQVWDIDEFCRKLKQKFSLDQNNLNNSAIQGNESSHSITSSKRNRNNSPSSLNQSRFRGNLDEDSDLASHASQDSSWKSFGSYCARFFRKPPTITFMNGPLEIDVVKRKKPVRRAKALETGEAIQPEQVNIQNEKKDESVIHVQNLHKKLKYGYRQAEKKNEKKHDHVKLSFWSIVLDPNSFTKTIENIFYYSFLLKDAHAGVRLDENKELLAAPLAQETAEDVDRRQCVLNLDYNSYLKLCELYGDEISKQDLSYSQYKPSQHNSTQDRIQPHHSENHHHTNHKRKREDETDGSKRRRTE